MNDKIFQEEILEHYKYPKYRKIIADPDFSAGQHNPSCGDRISIMGKVTDKKVTDIGFSGSGCVISQAASSMLTEECLNKNIDHILAITKDEITSMVGIPLGPTRLKCALLCLEVLQEGLLDYLKKEK